MISFYPGPSKIYEQVKNYLHEGFETGILSVNHRSTAFQNICKNACESLRLKLDVPEDYGIYFVSSATECWEIIAQSFIRKSSLHYFNGDFGQKWFKTTLKLKHCEFISFSIDDSISAVINKNFGGDLIAVTHNETSNGTQVSKEDLIELRKRYSDKLIAVDATSSMAGIHLDFLSADIWYASVQKCFGLPAGLAVLICSPAAIQAAYEINEHNHYNSFVSIHENMKQYQTTHTPNVLDIYLLSRLVDDLPNIKEVEKRIVAQGEDWYNFLESTGKFKPLIKNKAVRSDTVITVVYDEVDKLKKDFLEKNIYLGNGYGAWKSTTFRIANFPAITEHEIQILKEELRREDHG